MLVLEQGIFAAGAHDHRVLVAGIGTAHLAVVQIDDADPGRDEHLGVVAVAERVVGPEQDLRGRPARFRQVAQGRLGPHHEQGGRNALTRHIGDDQAHVVVVDKEEIVEISAHFLGGVHHREDLKVIPWILEVLGQGGILYASGKFQLLLDALLRGGDVALQHADGLVDVVGQRRKFRSGAHVDHLVEVAPGDLVQRLVDPLQVVHHDLLHQHGNQQVDHRKEQYIRQRRLIGLHVAVGIDLLLRQMRQQQRAVLQTLHPAEGLDLENLFCEERLCRVKALRRDLPFVQDLATVVPTDAVAHRGNDVKAAAAAHVEP